MKIIPQKESALEKQIIPEIEIINFEHQNIKQHFITAYPPKCRDTTFLLKYITKYIRDNDIKILSQFVFGSPGMCEKGLFNPGRNDWPVTYIHGDMATSRLLYGTQMYSISGSTCTPVFLNGSLVGTRYEDEDAEYCFLGDICPNDKNLSSSEQTLQTFGNIKKVLETTGMNFSHVVRTWFYLDKLYDWYSEFNEVRTAFFREQGIFDNLVPASTGIGAGNLHGTCLVSGVFAVKPKHPDVHIISIPSPLQCEASEYKSSFSRAVEIQFPAHRQLYISGTASIDSNGNSIHIGNINNQIDETMKVIGQIIESRSMSWSDAVRAIAYFKDITHATEFSDYCEKKHLPYFPVCYSQSDICRQELLFEMEIDFIRINDDGK